KESFLDLECTVICAIRAQRCVLGTGGSVIYRKAAMEHLKDLGFIVFLDVPLPVLKERISLNPERGIACAPGQTLNDLYRERRALYKRWSDISCNNCAMSASEAATTILRSMPKNFRY
ncbi:MAG: shikimate kinase, partial [Desulfovibrionaceae bacterium]|nr:shikimate kinase [Desulfovibrionaceae bacterium]